MVGISVSGEVSRAEPFCIREVSVAEDAAFVVVFEDALVGFVDVCRQFTVIAFEIFSCEIDVMELLVLTFIIISEQVLFVGDGGFFHLLS